MEANAAIPTTLLASDFGASGGYLYAHLITSPHASGTITSINATGARQLAGVAAVILANELGEKNSLQPLQPDEPLLAENTVHYLGQPVGIVVADSLENAKAAASLIETEYHPSPAILDIGHALALESFHGTPTAITRGDPETAMEKCEHTLTRKFTVGSQLPFCSEPLWARAIPAQDDTLIIQTPSELPSRVRAAVAAAIGVPESHVEVVSMPVDGLSGGRQSESALVATYAAIAARRTGSAVRLELPRRLDLALSAKRHAMQADYTVGYDSTGRIQSADIRLALDGGHRVEHSETTLDQALLHADGAYFVEHFRAEGRLCRTNHVTGSSLLAEGAAQGAMILEDALSRIAHLLGLPVEKVREVNLYRDEGNRHSTPYGQPVDSDPLLRIWSELLASSDFVERRKAIQLANAVNPCYKRGIAIVPAKFGIGDPRPVRNQAMALVQLLVDGSVCVRLGCIDAGDGLSRSIAEEAASQFGVHPDEVVVRSGDLHCTPHMCPRIGCDAAGLMRRAVADAAIALKKRLRPIAAQLLTAAGVDDVDADTLRFAESRVSTGGNAQLSAGSLTFSELLEAAWRRRTNMAAIGYHRTPNLWWDREVGAGWPFSGFVCGGAVAEVQFDAFTGEVQVLRIDLMHQGSGGGATAATLERAQISRAFQLGLGWMLQESVGWNDDGDLVPTSAEAYGIPGFGDSPLQFQIDLVPTPHQPAEFAVTSGAESAVFLATAAREATREAIRAFGTPINPKVEIDLPAPAVPSTVLTALREMSTHLSQASS